MIEQFLEHLSVENRAKLNRFLSHKKVTLAEVFRCALEAELRSAMLWDRARSLRLIEHSSAEIMAAVLTYKEVNITTLAKHEIRGRKIGYFAAENILAEMCADGLTEICGYDEKQDELFRVRQVPQLHLIICNE